MRLATSRSAFPFALVALMVTGLLAACGGGGGGASPTPATPVVTTTTAPPAPTAAPTYPPTQSASVTVGSTGQSATFGAVGSGYTAAVAISPATSGGGSAALVLNAGVPSGTASVSSVRRIPQTIGVALTAVLYLTFTPASNMTLATSPSFSFGLPSGYAFPSGTNTYVGFLDPTSSSGWINLIGPGVAGSGGSYTFAANGIPMVLKAGVTYTFAWYSTSAVVAPLATPSPSPTPTTTAAPGTGTPLSGPSVAPNAGWGPGYVANTFKFPVQSGFNGSGYTVAIVMDSNVSSSDLATYLSYFQIPSTSRTVTAESIDSASLTYNSSSSDAAEATLDAETVAGLAPGANVILYIIPSLSSQYYNDAFNQIITEGKANVVSISFAGCENTSNAATSAIVAKAAAAGIAFVAASGDQGSACYSSTNSSNQKLYAAGVNYPASDPSVIGVGASETKSSLTSTAVMNDNLVVGGAQEASGGGVSGTFALPSYQAGLVGAASQSYRNVPDLSMPGVYDAIYLNGAWGLESGTSWGAPQYAAMLAEIYQYCNASSATFTKPVQLAYAADSRVGYNGFLDITSGNNSYSLSTISTSTYNAQTAYDNASGIGVPYGLPIAQALCPNRVPSAAARAVASVAQTRTATAQAYAVNPTRPSGLSDVGRRSANQATRIQLVLLDSPSAAAAEQAVIGVLQAAGFTIVQTFGNHLIVDAQGSSAAVEQLFGTQIDNVDEGLAGMHYMPATTFTVPASLAPYVAGVSLDDVVNASPKR